MTITLKEIYSELSEYKEIGYYFLGAIIIYLAVCCSYSIFEAIQKESLAKKSNQFLNSGVYVNESGIIDKSKIWETIESNHRSVDFQYKYSDFFSNEKFVYKPSGYRYLTKVSKDDNGSLYELDVRIDEIISNKALVTVGDIEELINAENLAYKLFDDNFFSDYSNGRKILSTDELFNAIKEYEKIALWDDNCDLIEGYCDEEFNHNIEANGFKFRFVGECRKKYISMSDKYYDAKYSTLGILLLILMIFVEIPLIFKFINKLITFKSYRKTQHYQLRINCNPQRFIKHYNKDKIDKANALYRKIMNTPPNDNDTITSLINEAIQLYGIKSVFKKEYLRLVKRCDPSRYTKPYNAEKLELVNKLSSCLQKDDLSYTEFESVKNEARQL